MIRQVTTIKPKPSRIPRESGDDPFDEQANLFIEAYS